MKRIAVLASGRGSNFRAIMEAMKPLDINGEIVMLLTDNKDAYAIEIARAAGIPVTVINFKDFASRSEYEIELLSAMKKVDADLYVCAGYMKIIGKEIADTFFGKMINIHPALLPAFPGMHAQRQALDYGVKIAGCTVHFVDSGVDTGPIILQRAVCVYDDDTEEDIDERILNEEHKAFPEAIKLFCDDRLKIEGRKVKVLLPQ